MILDTYGRSKLSIRLSVPTDIAQWHSLSRSSLNTLQMDILKTHHAIDCGETCQNEFLADGLQRYRITNQHEVLLHSRKQDTNCNRTLKIRRRKPKFP